MREILRQQLRRDRVILPIWILGTAALLTVSAASVVTEYGDAAGRADILRLALATPALLALRGIPNGDSLGSAVHFQSFAFLAVTIGLMNTFLASRHGRAEEDGTRRELVLATPVARLAPPLATLILGTLANTVFAALATLGYLSAGLDPAGAVLSGVALGMTGLAFLGIGMLASEAAATSGAANGIGLVAVLGAYALRAAGDALGASDLDSLSLTAAWPSWFSPIGWGQQTLAFTEDRWWPVAAIGALAVLSIGMALAVHQRRELGASLLPERAGRARASALLSSPLGLAWRLQWPTTVAWAAGSALLGLALGSLITAVANADIESPPIEAVLRSLGQGDRGDLAQQLIPAFLLIVGAVAAASGVQSVLRLREEESAGRWESMLATPAARPGSLLAFGAVAAVTVAVVLLATGLATALGFAVLGETDLAWLSLGQSLVEIPAMLIPAAAGALLVAVLPRVAVAVGWAFYAIVVAIGLFGDLIGIPEWVEEVSPFATVPVIPDDDGWATVAVAAVVVVATIAAAAGIRRRDLAT